MRNGITSQVSLGSQLPSAQASSLSTIVCKLLATYLQELQAGCSVSRLNLGWVSTESIPGLPLKSTTGAWLQATKSLTSVGEGRTDWKPERADCFEK